MGLALVTGARAGGREKLCDTIKSFRHDDVIDAAKKEGHLSKGPDQTGLIKNVSRRGRGLACGRRHLWPSFGSVDFEKDISADSWKFKRVACHRETYDHKRPPAL